MNFAELIRLYMRVHDISMAKLADIIGIQPSQMRRLCEAKPVQTDTLLKVLEWQFGHPK